MTTYASQKVNTDPKPHVDGHGNRHDKPYADGHCFQCTTVERPRSMFDMGNTPNPILIAYRKHGPRLFGGTAGWLKYAMHGTMADNVPITPDHIEHARRVLARLDALSDAGQ